MAEDPLLRERAVSLARGAGERGRMTVSDRIERLRSVGPAIIQTAAAAALAWILAKPFVTTIIIGAKTMEQLDDNLAAAGLKLTAEDMSKLDAVSALPAEYPGWMLARQGAERVPQPK